MPGNKAFIFDMDGVIIDSETWWDKLWFYQLNGPSLGYSIRSNYQDFKKQNPRLTWQEFFAKMNRLAKTVYRQAPLTPGINQLLKKLVKDKYKIGLVSGSTSDWINYVLARLDYPVPVYLSLHDHPQLESKPAPDGYRVTMEQLQVKPENTIILEDSQIGIESAKAAGAYTICLTEHHPKNFHPTGADIYVKNIKELLTYLDSIQV